MIKFFFATVIFICGCSFDSERECLEDRDFCLDYDIDRQNNCIDEDAYKTCIQKYSKKAMTNVEEFCKDQSTYKCSN